jgi:DNA topoisomerase-1
VEQFTFGDEKSARAAEDTLRAAAAGGLDVVKVEKKQRRRNPAAPFTTSTLQQEASRKLGFTAQRTMRTAQQLYEGVDTGEGAVGLITYMRTDSVNLAREALDEIREVIAERYGSDNVPKEPRQYRTRAKNAQEAHEAIRPTSPGRDPDSVKSKLTSDQFRLYELIWKRTIACQMVHALFNTVAADLAAGKGNIFRATGSVLVSPGFIAVYQEGQDDKKKDDDEDRILPPLEEGERVTLAGIKTEQHFTEPPPRYTEASLVKALEEYGIGRPSTYASIISTLQQRDYVEMDRKRFKPTDVGSVVNKFLTQHFTRYVDYDFTAELENELDEVSRGEKDWVPLLRNFWQPFKHLVDEKEEKVSRAEVTQEQLDENCPKCGKQLTIRLGRRGKFIGCTGYPECDYTRNVDEDAAQAEPEVVEGRTCPDCGSDLIIRSGRYGKFIGCSAYPKCRHIEPLEKPKDTGIQCPECKQGSMLKRKSRYGKIFYSCSRYPDCKYAVWNEPMNGPCPDCGWPILTIKTTKRRGTEKVCPQKECKFAEPAPELAPEPETTDS